MSSYKLRPHHGLCLHYFSGSGYSADFIANMQEIKSKLSENPEIVLFSEADDLCRCCPNRVGESGCISDEKVLGYDQAVLNHTDLKPGQKLNWLDFYGLVQHNILNQNLREQICGCCQWTDLCK